MPMENPLPAQFSAVAPSLTGERKTAMTAAPCAPGAGCEGGAAEGGRAGPAILTNSADEARAFVEGEGLIEALFAQLSEESLGSFTQEQRQALAAAAAKLRWGRHPIDIRLSLPTLLSRYYLVVVGGRERRDKKRRHEESRRHRFNTWKNWLFVLAVVGLAVYAIGMIGAFALPWYWEELILQ